MLNHTIFEEVTLFSEYCTTALLTKMLSRHMRSRVFKILTNYSLTLPHNAAICSAVRPDVKVERLNGKNVIVVSVSELDERSKPLFFKSEGLPRGAYRRIGPTDRRCTENDLPLFYTSCESYDSIAVRGTTMDDADGELQAERNTGMSEKVIREAIVNAFIHRTYRVNQPIQIIRYTNRIEIINISFAKRM